ncbi:hypothetical protein KJ991_00865 [Patescibacteria group bacterium]|nr:hypothetical protein [Patescibacteria group bacterium]MBU4057478.1 hypothetical protein [Patescibacteria group bacterium]MBU4115961.1 hypothetical protein [Patescibacteria group bacterium]
MFSYIIFIISLLGLALLFSIRIFEFQKGRVIISENIKDNLERKTRKHLSVLCFCTSHFNRHNIIRLSFFIYEEIKVFVVKIFHSIIGKIKNSDFKIVKVIMGKKILKRDGDVSSFLNDIADFKRENGLNNQKIDKEDLGKFEN